MKSKKTLSEMQKEVILAARNGAMVSVFGCNGVNIYPYSHFNELFEIGLFEKSKENQFIYQLTETGKNLEL